MKALVDKEICIGCGACTGVCPEVFDMDNDGLAVAITSEIDAEFEGTAAEAQDCCPVGAITVE
ncbi:MAG: ferredoxin [Peptostreptococcaceae bacterium]